MRVLCYCLTILGALATAAGAQTKPVVTVNVRGDAVEYDRASGALSASGRVAVTAATEEPGNAVTVHLRGDTASFDRVSGAVSVAGNVTMTAATDRPGMPTVSLAAEQLSGNLNSGTLVASQGVRLRSQQVAVRGESVELNFRRDEFLVRRGALEADVPSEDFPGRVLRGFFFGDEIRRTGSVHYVIHARVTTCNEPHPHYSVGSDRITYDTVTHLLSVQHGTLQLYGLRLHLPGNYSTKLFEPEGPPETDWGLPGYSSSDGLYTALKQPLSSAGADWDINAAVRVGTRLRLPGAISAVHQTDLDTLQVRATRLEQVTYDLDKSARLSWVPEISYVRHLQRDAGGLSRLDLKAYAGRAHERVDNTPVVSAARAGLSLEYSPRPWQRRARRGLWWAAGAEQAFYDTGQRRRDLRLELGTGWRFREGFGAAAWAVHHFTDGTTPFRFDEVYVEDELFTAVDARLDRKWSVSGLGHWDLDEGDLRDYSVSVSRRLHCLTWSLKYDFAREELAIGLNLNGLTGGTEPPETAPLLGPDDVPPLPAMVPADPARASPGLLLPGAAPTDAPSAPTAR